MDFRKGPLTHEIENTQVALQRDLDAYEARLEGELDLRERAILEDKIKKIKDEMRKLEGVSSVPANTLLLNGLKNNIDEIEEQLKNENDLKKRSELEARRLKCLDTLQDRQKKISGLPELNDAVDQIVSDQRLIDGIADRKLDEVDLDIFMNSGMLSFVDGPFEGEIRTSYTQMIYSDNVQSTLGRSQERIAEKADNDWTHYQKEVEDGLEALENEINEINGKLPKADARERETLRRRLKEIESEKKYYEAEIKEGRSDWEHRRRTDEERYEASKSVLGSVKPEVLDKLGQLLTEAQALRTEKIIEYLKSEFAEVEKQLAEAKSRGRFSGKTITSLEEKLDEVKNAVFGARALSPSDLRQFAVNFQKTRAFLASTEDEIRNVREKRPAMEKQIREEYRKFDSALSRLTTDKIQNIRQKLLAEMKAEGRDKDSPIFRSKLNILNQLEDPNSDLHKQKKEFEARLAELSETEPEELLAILQDLERMKSVTESLENVDADLTEALSPANAEVQLAHKTIEQLERAVTAGEVKKILEENLGAEHLELIPHSEFENKFRKHTRKGDMVFQEKGEKWKVIIDETIFSGNKDLKELKHQLIHELHHLEFEKSDKVKAGFRKMLIEDKPEQWKEIRAAYLDLVKGKKPPHGNEWQDDDILSELWAMQKDFSKEPRKGNKPFDKLNNLLAGADILDDFGNLSEKTRGYQKANEEEAIHGFEGEEKGEKKGGAGPEEKPVINSQANYEKYKHDIDNIRDRFKDLRRSDYIGMVSGAGELIDVMEHYNEQTAGLNSDLHSDPGSELLANAVGARVKKVSEDLNELEDQVSKAARKAPNDEIGFFRKLWINTSFHSIGDYVQAGKDVYEFFARRHKRSVGDHAAQLGMAFFSGTDLGREALARKHASESEEVNEWKKRYEHLDAWHLNEELKSLAHSPIPNPDQLKAIIRILASKGRLNWRNQDLWVALNKLQSAVILKPGDQMLLHDPVLLGQRLHRALGEIYDYDEYISLERQQGTTYGSEKKKYEPVHNRMQDKLTDRLNELLAEHRAGEHVDPILYESICEYCIEKGKSYAENVMFHLIAGMAEGLLGPDRGLALGNHLNSWPPIDWFPTRKPPYSTADWKRFCKQRFPDSFKKGVVQGDFKSFFWTEIQNSQLVVERVKKSVGERSWDHDWARSIACLGDSTTAKQFLMGRSGQIETKATAVGNAYVGAVQWLEENAKNPQFATRENFARIAGWIAMAEGMLDRTAYLSKDKEINTRASDSMNRDVPRENSFGNHEGRNTGEHRALAARILYLLDGDFFRIFLGKEALTDDQKKGLGTQARDYLVQRYPSLAQSMAQVETIDQIFDRIDLIISTMFQQLSQAQFQSILAQLAMGSKSK